MVGEIKAIYLPANVPRVQITHSKDAAKFAHTFWQDINYYECFYIIHLNRANATEGWTKISQGGTAATYVDPKLIYHSVVSTNTQAIILVHNHPSGNLEPSNEDIRITKEIKAGCALLKVSVIDHIILGENGHFSFADEGLL